MQRVTLAFKVRSQLAVGDPPAYSDGVRPAVQDNLVQMGQRNLIFGAVGNPVKGMASTQRPQFAAALHHLLHFLHCPRLVQAVGTVSVISRPVCSFCSRLLARAQWRQHGAGKEDTRGL